jgi:POT family proton-dependent oligopeptide transporter
MMTIVGILITFPLWRWLALRGREPDTMQKFVVAGVFVALAYAVLAVGSARFDVVPLVVVVLFFVLFDMNFGWTDPPSYGFIARFAPAALITTLMSVNQMLSSGLPFFTVGWLGRFYEPLGPVDFWWLHAGIAAAGSVLALALRPLVAYLLGRAEKMAPAIDPAIEPAAA